MKNKLPDAEPADSPALAFVRHLYVFSQQATDHSWQRLNAALFGAVKVAIEGGLEFAEDDFAVFRLQFKGGYWLGSPPDGFAHKSPRAVKLHI